MNFFPSEIIFRSDIEKEDNSVDENDDAHSSDSTFINIDVSAPPVAGSQRKRRSRKSSQESKSDSDADVSSIASSDFEIITSASGDSENPETKNYHVKQKKMRSAKDLDALHKSASSEQSSGFVVISEAQIG